MTTTEMNANHSVAPSHPAAQGLSRTPVKTLIAAVALAALAPLANAVPYKFSTFGPSSFPENYDWWVSPVSINAAGGVVVNRGYWEGHGHDQSSSAALYAKPGRGEAARGKEWKVDHNVLFVGQTNSHGQAVGSAYSTDYEVEYVGASSALLFNGGKSSVLPLPLPGWHQSFTAWATAINEAGQIVGGLNTFWDSYPGNATGKDKPLTWINGEVQMLPTLKEGNGNGWALALNNAGVIVGYSGPFATQWVNGKVSRLPQLGANAAVARSINDDGVIVGDSQTTTGSTRAVAWRHQQLIDLGGSGQRSSAHQINNAGTVVGNMDGRAVMWDADGHMTDVNALLPADATAAGWSVTNAVGINDRGVILGWCSNPVQYIEISCVLEPGL